MFSPRRTYGNRRTNTEWDYRENPQHDSSVMNAIPLSELRYGSFKIRLTGPEYLKEQEKIST
jgi:hypothetical protein